MNSNDTPFPRVVDLELDELLTVLPAISVDGAKGVGKTMTASQRARTRYDLDEETSRAVFEADAKRITLGETPILIDEWHRAPSSWDVIRRAVDRDRRPGQFILTGSAAPIGVTTHSGAGRIVEVRMRPMTLFERGIGEPTVSLAALLTGEDRIAIGGDTNIDLEIYVQEIIAGGFPGMRSSRGRASHANLDSYLARIVDRDFPEMAHSLRSPDTLMRWLRAYAAATSTSASLETIRSAASSLVDEVPAKTTLIAYRDVLERLRILDPVPNWSPTRNQIAKLIGSPKHHLCDPALAARLLRVDASALLGGSNRVSPTLLGQLFESLIALNLRVYAQASEAMVGHLRTRGGLHEVDFIVVRDDQRIVAIEVKLSAAIGDTDVVHLRWLKEKLRSDLIDAAVINTGPYAYRRKDGIAVIPAALLGP